MVRRGARQGRSKRKENEKKVVQQPFFFTQKPFCAIGAFELRPTRINSPRIHDYIGTDWY